MLLLLLLLLLLWLGRLTRRAGLQAAEDGGALRGSRLQGRLLQRGQLVAAATLALGRLRGGAGRAPPAAALAALLPLLRRRLGLGRLLGLPPLVGAAAKGQPPRVLRRLMSG
jgi:hypothetical protein